MVKQLQAQEQEARLKAYRSSQIRNHVSSLTKKAVDEERAKELAKNDVPRSSSIGIKKGAKIEADGWTQVWS